ncbi:efflux RND transporter periplasmic adaptor subunit [Rhodocytophaga aerolata]|uniref:Efflux RND transporter periplasmic adaptor subunit n=1 Tax=Rhodocytophaga aerolata TaxID=455078 RepID=A0ABT8RAU1_9BACT|nr:efflux RND transporter periplasmic adaptor subunit [Rhodocytophaga aerolata]MDO1449221.1 efflux RND transporter periplasmic adaptor subunit [Rhodocytophaga aerolata]
MKKILMWSQIILATILLTMLLSSCETSEAETNSGATQAPMQKLPVDVKVVQASSYQQDELIVGTIVANRQVEIVSEIPRKVISITFKDGTYIQKGQLLYKLDDADLKAKLKKIEAQLVLARTDEKRLSELLKTQAVREQEYDQVLSTLQALQAEEELLQVELSKTEIRAPFAGRIGISKVHEGTLVGPNMVLTNLQDVSKVKIHFAIPEKYIGKAKEGTKITFKTDFSEESYTAQITATEPHVDAGSRSLLVEAIANNPQNELRAGLSAKVSFPTISADAQAIMIPSEALIPSPQGYTVFTIKNGTARAQAVKVQNRTESEAMILEGLSSGDTIMVSNVLRAGDGVPVQIVSAQ